MTHDRAAEGRSLLESYFAGAGAAGAVAIELPGAVVEGVVCGAQDGARWALLRVAAPAGAPRDRMGDDAPARARDLVEVLRRATSLSNLERFDFDLGFRVEELFYAHVRARTPALLDATHSLLARVAGPTFVCDGVVDPALGTEVTLEAALRERHESLERDTPRYLRLPDGRVRVEALEFHVVEHCNLHCTHCCNMSPYLDARALPVDEVRRLAQRMAQLVRADVFKVMGGEPLLHPEITTVLGVIRASGVSPVVRLFTNGLLLHTMPDEFFAALDQLTISVYASAPMKPAHLAWVREQCARHDVVLNVKEVDRFSRVMNNRRRDDPAALQRVYDACWLRHRCLIVRDGRFSKCTRAAYQREFHQRIAVDVPVEDPIASWLHDTLSIDDPDFAEGLLAYLERKTPLDACRYCDGSSGALVPHTQLTRRAVRGRQLENGET